MTFLSCEQKEILLHSSGFSSIWKVANVLHTSFWESQNFSFSKPQFFHVWNAMDEFLLFLLRLTVQKERRYYIELSMLWFPFLAVWYINLGHFTSMKFFVCTLDVRRALQFNLPCTGDGLFLEKLCKWTLYFADFASLPSSDFTCLSGLHHPHPSGYNPLSAQLATMLKIPTHIFWNNSSRILILQEFVLKAWKPKGEKIFFFLCAGHHHTGYLVQAKSMLLKLSIALKASVWVPSFLTIQLSQPRFRVHLSWQRDMGAEIQEMALFFPETLIQRRRNVWGPQWSCLWELAQWFERKAWAFWGGGKLCLYQRFRLLSEAGPCFSLLHPGRIPPLLLLGLSAQSLPCILTKWKMCSGLAFLPRIKGTEDIGLWNHLRWLFYR